MAPCAGERLHSHLKQMSRISTSRNREQLGVTINGFVESIGKKLSTNPEGETRQRATERSLAQEIRARLPPIKGGPPKVYKRRRTTSRKKPISALLLVLSFRQRFRSSVQEGNAHSTSSHLEHDQ